MTPACWISLATSDMPAVGYGIRYEFGIFKQNIQRGKDGNAKAYQVRQVLDAIARLEAEKNEESDNDA